MAIYRSCACLELNKLKSRIKVDERSVDILVAGVMLMGRWPMTAVSDSRELKHQHCWYRAALSKLMKREGRAG